MSEVDVGTSAPRETRRVLLTVHTGRRDIVELARTSAARLLRGGIAVRVLAEESAELAIEGAEVAHAHAEAAQGVEIVMVFGGDGTFLRAAELARYSDAALMGVNLGRVGFLAETEPEAVEETLSACTRSRSGSPWTSTSWTAAASSWAAPGRSTRSRWRRPSAPGFWTSSSRSTAGR